VTADSSPPELSSSAILRRLSVGLVGLALAGTAALVSAPAQAMPLSGAGAQCLQPASRTAPAVRRIQDTPDVSDATLARVEREVEATAPAVPDGSFAARSAALPTYRVKVQIHVIHGTHKGEHRLKKRGARRKVFRHLRLAYNGAESTASESMGIDFRLKRITVTRNDRWYHARMNSRADKQMKRKLHRGTAQTLNIYVNHPRPPAGFTGVLLGYSRFPWQYRHHKTMDGVTINVRSLPIPGSKAGYNLGDTTVHETGHWLGLLHPFQGGNDDPKDPQCDATNDGVADTPAEYAPNFTCVPGYVSWLPDDKARSTVCDPQAMKVNGYFDPALNFMDYSLDACMRLFTVGQRARVAKVFATYRNGR
jgi:hypothetical protein